MSTLPAEPARQPSGDGSASPVPGTAALAREVRRLADRFRHLSESRLKAPVTPDDPSDPGRSRAAAGLALARSLAALGDAPRGHEVPDLGVFAVGDQIAVTGLDLVAHLARSAAAAASEKVPEGGAGQLPERAADGAVDGAVERSANKVAEDALRAVRELAALV